MNMLAPSQPSQEITKFRRIGFLIYPNCEICDVCGPLDVFHFADYWLPRFGRTDEPGYQLVILAATPGPIRTHSGIEIVATQSCYDIKDGLDTLIVSGGINVEEACKDDPALVEWVRAMAPRARRVASICTGAFILAAAGLLNHRHVTTHWMFSEALATKYPSISGRFQPPLRSRRQYLHFGRDHRGDRSGPDFGGRRSRPGNYARRRPDDGGFSPAPRRAIPIQCFSDGRSKEPARHPRTARVDPRAPGGGSQRTRTSGSHGHEPAQFRAAVSQRDRRDAGAVYRTGAVRGGPLQTRTNHRTGQTIAEQCGFGNAERMRRTFQRLFDISPQDYRARFRSTLLT